jgi:hypothetical protein
MANSSSERRSVMSNSFRHSSPASSLVASECTGRTHALAAHRLCSRSIPTSTARSVRSSSQSIRSSAKARLSGCLQNSPIRSARSKSGSMRTWSSSARGAVPRRRYAPGASAQSSGIVGARERQPTLPTFPQRRMRPSSDAVEAAIRPADEYWYGRLRWRLGRGTWSLLRVEHASWPGGQRRASDVVGGRSRLRHPIPLVRFQRSTGSGRPEALRIHGSPQSVAPGADVRWRGSLVLGELGDMSSARGAGPRASRRSRSRRSSLSGLMAPRLRRRTVAGVTNISRLGGLLAGAGAKPDPASRLHRRAILGRRPRNSAPGS